MEIIEMFNLYKTLCTPFTVPIEYISKIEISNF